MAEPPMEQPAGRVDNQMNPYLASPLSAEQEDSKPPATLNMIAREIFWDWEKLRVVYVAILAAFTLLLLIPSGRWDLFLDIEFWRIAIPGAIIANLCYFAGPTLETYARWLGYRGRWGRRIAFCAGTGFSLLLVAGAMATFLLPDQ